MPVCSDISSACTIGVDMSSCVALDALTPQSPRRHSFMSCASPSAHGLGTKDGGRRAVDVLGSARHGTLEHFGRWAAEA